MRRAKIVCTLGPASREPAFIGHLIDEGMDVVRLNFSHGEHADHAATVAAVRREAERRDRPVAILQDLQGPKIRVGRFAEGMVDLEPGADFTLTTREVVGSEMLATTTYSGLPADVSPGDVLLLDDGLLSLEVERVEGSEVHTRVLVGGTLKNNKGINLPGVRVSAPALTPKDRADLAFGLELGVDFVALSFVRSAADVREAVALCTRSGDAPPHVRRVPVIAKIERPEAVEHLEEIIEAADGLMVARGDLGVELGPEKVPLIQKRAIELTNAHGKVVITATQMLESMIVNPRPTRAEASDVANAVLDGSDALMLSGETATGRYPLLAVRTMARIIEEIETSARFRNRPEQPMVERTFSTHAIAKSAVVAARLVEAKVIACVSESGAAARLVSEYRPQANIVAFTSHPEVYRRLALYWGVDPLTAPHEASFDALVATVGRQLTARGLAQPGDLAVITAAVPLGSGTSTNTLHVHKLP